MANDRRITDQERCMLGLRITKEERAGLRLLALHRGVTISYMAWSLLEPLLAEAVAAKKEWDARSPARPRSTTPPAEEE